MSIKIDIVHTCVFTHFLIRYIFLSISIVSPFHTYLHCGDRTTFYRNLEDFNPLSDSGLKKYMEIKIFPCIHLKVGSKVVSLSTVHCWLHLKGFQYISHKKGLYFDGHD